MNSTTATYPILSKAVAALLAAHIFFAAHPYLLISVVYRPFTVTIVLDIPDMDEDIYYRKAHLKEYTVKDEVRRDGAVKGKRVTVRIHAIPNLWGPLDYVFIPTLKEILTEPESLDLNEGFVPFIFHPPKHSA